MALDVEKVATRLREGGFENVRVEPSAVQGSPYDYVYVYLTDRDHEGPHLIVSDAEEYEDEPGIIVGKYSHFEEPADEGQVLTVETQEEALEWCLKHVRQENR